MKFSLTELMEKVTGLQARADAAFKAELDTVKASVAGELTQISADLEAAKASLVSLGTEKLSLTASVTDITAKLLTSENLLSTFNSELTKACIAGNLLELKGDDEKPLAADAPAEVVSAKASAVSIETKFKAYQGSLNAAFAKAGIPIPALPAAPVSGQAAAPTTILAEFSAITDPTEKTKFYRKHKAAIDQSFK